MKKLLFALILFPLFAKAQNLPRLENDTLYTSSGFNIYNGSVLQLANGTSAAGYFRFIKFKAFRTDTYNLQNSSLQVSKLKGLKSSGDDDYSIRITGTVTLPDGKQEEVELVVNFDKAIESPDKLPDEIKVPEEYKKQRKEIVAEEPKIKTKPVDNVKQKAPDDIKNLLIADEIKKLFDLYKAGALTKDEYEAQKKKLLDRQ